MPWFACSPRGWDAMPWPLGVVFTVGFWGLLIWGGVAMFRTVSPRGRHRGSALAARLASGRIGEDEYRRPQAVAPSPQSPPLWERL